ncbi:MAG: HEAT repeat domain-containing protein [Anaerolineae bacterium]|nr:HEAT repeat domain-containing protein [Anaerolineae bacterium]
MAPTDSQERGERPALDATLQLLNTMGEGAVPAAAIYGLDGLSGEEIERLATAWPSLDDDVRRRILFALGEAAEASFEFDFNPVGRMALGDPSGAVRALAVDLLWEDTSLDVMEQLLVMVRDDDAVDARVAAAIGLGQFVLMGELEEIDAGAFKRAQEILLDIFDDESEDIEVRRRALEAVSNSTTKRVEQAIHEAYQSDEQRMKVSALFAMGCSADERWAPIVLDELGSDDRELRFEAARAAGELELEDAIPALTQIVFDDDAEIRDVAVWSLGEIGGREAKRVLQDLSEEARASDDDDLLNTIEDAIASANIGGDPALYLLDMDDQDE